MTRLQLGAGHETSTEAVPEPARCASCVSGGEIVHTPFSAFVPVAADVLLSTYSPGLRSVVNVLASAGGQTASSRHLPSLVCTATGGSLTVGLSPLRNWS